MKTGQVILGLIAGAAVGAIAGVLFAPNSGDETRKRLTKKSYDVADDLKDKFNDFVDSVTSKVDEVDEMAHAKGEKVKAKAEKISHNNK